MGGGGRDQRGPMERLVRLAVTLHHAGPGGVPAERLIEIAGFADAADATSALNRELRHLRDQGWHIHNVAEPGLPAVYRMQHVDSRLRVRLTPAQQAALLRAVLLADRADLAARLGLDDADRPVDLPAAVPAAVDDPRLSTAIRAVRRASLLRFRYHGRARVVHPQSVRVEHATWRLRGREEGVEGPAADKVYVVSRMHDVVADAPGTATPPVDFRHTGLHPMSWQVDPAVDVTLTAPTEYAPDVRRWLDAPLSQTEADGTTTFVYRVTHRSALRSRLHQLGTRVRVEGPDEVRRELLESLAQMAGE